MFFSELRLVPGLLVAETEAIILSEEMIVLLLN